MALGGGTLDSHEMVGMEDDLDAFPIGFWSLFRGKLAVKLQEGISHEFNSTGSFFKV